MAADALGKITGALNSEAKTAFANVVTDIDKHLIPTMAMIARALVTIGAELKAGEISQELAEIEVAMQKTAAASVLVGFANTGLLEVQRLVNAVLEAVRDVVNTTLKVAVL